MASFTDQKQRVVTKEDLQSNWGGGGPGVRFRCYFCGHKFKVGDLWRWIYHGGEYINFIVCDDCDTGDLEQMRCQWTEINKEARNKFWWINRADTNLSLNPPQRCKALLIR